MGKSNKGKGTRKVSRYTNETRLRNKERKQLKHLKCLEKFTKRKEKKKELLKKETLREEEVEKELNNE